MERVKETRLKDLLRQGIAYLHEGMHEADQVTVQALFESGAIQVCCDWWDPQLGSVYLALPMWIF